MLTDAVKLFEVHAGKGTPAHAVALLDLAELWMGVGDPGDAEVAASVLRKDIIPPLRAYTTVADSRVKPTDAPRAVRLLGDLVLHPPRGGEPDLNEAYALYTEVCMHDIASSYSRIDWDASSFADLGPSFHHRVLVLSPPRLQKDWFF